MTRHTPLFHPPVSRSFKYKERDLTRGKYKERDLTRGKIFQSRVPACTLLNAQWADRSLSKSHVHDDFGTWTNTTPRSTAVLTDGWTGWFRWCTGRRTKTKRIACAWLVACAFVGVMVVVDLSHIAKHMNKGHHSVKVYSYLTCAVVTAPSPWQTPRHTVLFLQRISEEQISVWTVEVWFCLVRKLGTCQYR